MYCVVKKFIDLKGGVKAVQILIVLIILISVRRKL